MKRFIFPLAVMLLSVGAMAQTWRVVKKDGSVVRFPAAAVEYVTIAMSDDQSGSIDGHEYVDLGLPSGTLWATCNVGASKPEAYGNYFAWGETMPKDEYSWETYKWCNVVEYDSLFADTLLTRYNFDSKYGYNGFTDNLTELLPEDDAAYVNWGPNWCMPDSAQIAELIDSTYTTAEWVTQNGTYGCRITSKTNGNSIFLPAAGARYWTWSDGDGSDIVYWSRTLCEGWNFPYISLTLESDNHWKPYEVYVGAYYRCQGLSIRPVRAFAENGQIASITLNHSLLTLYPDSTAQLTATVMPSSVYGNRVAWTSSDDNVATVDQTGKVTAVRAGACFIICVATDGSGVTATCEVTVLGNADTHEYVDLGLPSGTLWATCNIGANSPEEYGDYFAWGETKPKYEYSWDTYKWCSNTFSGDSLLTRYCFDSQFGYNGFTDDLKGLLLEDDAAYVNWGPNWCMPDSIQMAELIDSIYTTAEWTTVNDVYGCKITSKTNGNSIFLPAAGARYGTHDNGVGRNFLYWSRTLSWGWPRIAVGLRYQRYWGLYVVGDVRCYGQSIRPVRMPW